MFFIVSTGRSGTVTISRLLSVFPGCTCVHEPEPELILESSGYRYGEVDEKELARILRRTRSPRVDGEIYCESNQTLSLIIPVLHDVFPQARYIWLLRNGLDVVASAMARNWYRNDAVDNDRSELEHRWLKGRIRGGRCGDVAPEKWAEMGHFEKRCWYWTYINTLIESDLNRLCPDAYRLVKLENLAFEMRSLARWMDVPCLVAPTPKRHNVSKRRPYRWPDWNTAERQAFERWCGPLMDRYYPDWRDDQGHWQDISYCSPSGFRSSLTQSYTLVAIINRIYQLLCECTSTGSHRKHH